MVDRTQHRYGASQEPNGSASGSREPAEGPTRERMVAMNDQVGHDVRHAFHDELDAIDDAFVTAGLHVAEALPRMSAGFLTGDRSIMAEAEALATATANTCELVDEAGFILLARQAPVGGDLRRLVALLRMTVDVNRSASLLRHACMTLDTFDPRFLANPLRSQLDELATQSCEVFAAGMDAWRRRDALAVAEVDLLDENVDELQRVLLRETQGGSEDVGPGMLVLGLLARYFERIADHGVEIARDAAFVATGQRVRVGRHKDAEVAAAEAAASEVPEPSEPPETDDRGRDDGQVPDDVDGGPA